MLNTEKPPHVLSLPLIDQVAPQTWFKRLLFGGQRLDQEDPTEKTHPWHKILWLTGVDYFSTLGYQPGIALLAAGALSIPATAILVVVTLLAAVPVYAEVAKRSYVGQGSIALLENLFSGWKSKLFVLILLGFAATDFIITMTLSAADAARHAIANSLIHPYVGDSSVLLTLGLLFLLALVFLVGFSEAIGLAQIVVVPYLVLNLIVLLRGLWEVFRHPELVRHWDRLLTSHGDWTAIFLVSALLFPKLALGLSGFETGVSVMPLITNENDTSDDQVPQGRIRSTHKLLLTAALIMSVMLLLSSAVANFLIPESEYRIGGNASGRAIAYLAHHYLGATFGTIYDLSTILILWFAGASAMAGLLNLIPRYLPRFGMVPRWVSYRRPLVLALLTIDIVITLIFRASVEAQGGAYATGVLVLMLSAAVAVCLALWKECTFRTPLKILRALYFVLISLVFLYTLLDNIHERPDGIIIAATFIFLLLVASAISRSLRATELRITDLTLIDDESARLWQTIVGKKISLIPYHGGGPTAQQPLEQKIRQHYVITEPLAFLHVNLQDNRSEFLARLRLRITHDGTNYHLEVYGAVAVANAVAYLCELLDPISVILALTTRNLMKQSIAYLLFGEGETALVAYSILVRRWQFTGKKAGRPLVFLMSSS
ncbi:MAG TPA: hypothetical protein VL495_07615 [Edaphobacter sp.]|nr:hypothetical protein [Edaphobacter sp.]